jgi:hypothetical protein
MGILLSTLGCLSTIYPDAKRISLEDSRRLQIRRLIAKVPTIAAWAYRHSIGRPYVYPDNDLSFTGNFLNMLFKMTELKYNVNPTLERALDVLFILHADHEQNCSTSVMRGIGSSQADPYTALAGAARALAGPLHGGANEAVLRMLNEIGHVKHVPEFIKKVKGGDGPPDGVRPPGLQVLRSRARASSSRPPTRCLPSLARIRCSTSRSSSSGLPSKTTTSSAASSIQRGLLFGPDLSGHELPCGHVPRAVRDSAHGRLAGAVGRNAPRSRPEDRPAASDIHRREHEGLQGDRQEIIGSGFRVPGSVRFTFGSEVL